MNEIKYNPQFWGEPIDGEILSSNGYYTGEHKGAPMQDALAEDAQIAHAVEDATVHLGTITQDAIEGSMPTVIED